MTNEYFYNITKPTMSELIKWFQIEYTKLANDMKASNHATVDNEPNPYHLEDSVWTHTMMVCMRAEIQSETEYNKINMLSALLHDIGKPLSREVIPFNKPKPVHSDSNQLRNDGKDGGVHSELGKNQKKFPDSLIDRLSDEELKLRFADEYREYLVEINQ